MTVIATVTGAVTEAVTGAVIGAAIGAATGAATGTVAGGTGVKDPLPMQSTRLSIERFQQLCRKPRGPSMSLCASLKTLSFILLNVDGTCICKFCVRQFSI